MVPASRAPLRSPVDGVDVVEVRCVRVLLVDDNEPWRRYLRDTLEKHPGWEIVAEGSNGFEAVQKAAAVKPDLILLDIELPIQSGIAAARQILAADPQSRIFFISGHRCAAIVGAALETGARGYLLKSDAHQLVAAVDAIARGDRFISDGLS
jgi:DNA-binding NarL/FixJ family response regulator